MMNSKTIFTCVAAGLLAASTAFGQSTLAKWTFETTQPAGTPGAGVWLTNIAAEVGTGTASGLHAGNATYSSTSGNGSPHSMSSALWAVGDCYQFAVSTKGVQGISISFDQIGSGTGPGQFNLAYSTDGINFTTFTTSPYVVTTTSWSTTSPKTGSSYSFDLSQVTSLNDASVIYLRLVDASTTSAGGGTVGTGGTDRIDNVVVMAAGPVSSTGRPSIFTDVQGATVYTGRTVQLQVVANGSDPLRYQWYYPNLNTPLSDNGTISGTTSATLTLSSITTNQSGNYQVIIANDFGSVTSAVATLAVKAPIATNIAYLRTLQDTSNWSPTDRTNLYSVQGTVTTFVNMTSAGNAEFYIQDGTNGIAVFISGGTSIPDAGTLVQVTGPLSQYNGLLEMSLSASNPDHSVTTLGGNPLPTPLPLVFSSAANIPYMEAREGSLVVVSNVFLGATNGYFTASGQVTMTNLAGQTFTLFINANETDIIGQPVPAFASSITGVLGQYKTAAPYNSGYELDPTQSADIVAGTPPPPSSSPIPLKIQHSGSQLTLTWDDPSFSLQASPSVNGTFTNVPTASSPYNTTMAPQAPSLFFRLVQSAR